MLAMSMPRFNDSFARRVASGGSPAMRSASSMVRAMRSSWGTSHCARPMRYASSASIGQPSAARMALPFPTHRARRGDPP